MLSYCFGVAVYSEKTLLMSVLPAVFFTYCISRLLGEPLAALCGLALPSSLPFWSLIPCSSCSYRGAIRPQCQETQVSKGFGMLLPRDILAATHSPSFQAAPGLEIPVNVCWFLGSGMCVYTSCGWDNWLSVLCDGDVAKGKWRKGNFENKNIRQN